MQIQNLASITQKYPQFPTALSFDLPHPDETFLSSRRIGEKFRKKQHKKKTSGTEIPEVLH